MILVAAILYVLGCVLMVDNIRATPPDERWTQSGFVLLIIVWTWPLGTAIIFMHDYIFEPLLRPLLRKKPRD